MTAPTIAKPTATLIGEWEPGTAEWHAARRHRVGGSEVAPILALSPWDSWFSLWHRKKGAIGDLEESDEMRWGRILEQPICDEFANRHPDLDVQHAGTFVHVDRDWQLANPDRLAWHRESGELIVVEAKVARFDDEWGDEGSGDIPPQYGCQVQWYMDTLGAERAFVPVLFGGSDYREFVVKYDPALAEETRGKVRAFLDSLEGNVQPDIDKHTATYTALRELHPDIDDVDVEISPGLAKAYADACQAVKDAADIKQLAVNTLLGVMGTARRAVCCGQRIAMRVPGRGDNPPFLRPAK